MHSQNNFKHCRICGLLQDENEFPWGKDGTTASFEDCYCCAVTFGYQDCFLKGIKSYREAWIKKGAVWQVPELKPDNWSLEEQLKGIPEEFK
jgi:hypothetical protein